MRPLVEVRGLSENSASPLVTATDTTLYHGHHRCHSSNLFHIYFREVSETRSANFFAGVFEFRMRSEHL